MGVKRLETSQGASPSKACSAVLELEGLIRGLGGLVFLQCSKMPGLYSSCSAGYSGWKSSSSGPGKGCQSSRSLESTVESAWSLGGSEFVEARLLANFLLSDSSSGHIGFAENPKSTTLSGSRDRCAFAQGISRSLHFAHCEIPVAVAIGAWRWVFVSGG